MSLKNRTVHGLQWSYISTFFQAGIQIVYTAVMARLLDPAAFGLVAMAEVVIRFGSYFARMGLGRALIQKKDISNRDVAAVFSGSIFLGLIFYIVIFAGAPLSVYLFDDPNVIPVVRVLGLSFVINGLSTTSISLLRRKIRFKELAVVQVTASLVGYILIGAPMAYFGFGVWSLIFATLSRSLIVVLISYLQVRHKIQLVFNKEYFSPLINFGSKVSIISFIEFVRSNIDTMIIGKFFSASTLGIYNRAYKLISLPMQYLTNSSSQVIFPAFSKIQEDKPKLQDSYLKALGLLSQFIFPIGAFFLVSSEQIVLTILGSKWEASIPVLKIVSFPVVFMLIGHLGGILCESIAKLRAKAIIVSINILIVVGFSYMLRAWGIQGIAYSVLVGYLFSYLAYFYVIHRLINIDYSGLIEAQVPGILTAFSLYFVIFIFQFIFEPLNHFYLLSLIIQLVIGGVVIITLTLFGPFRKIRHQIKELLVIALSEIIPNLDNKPLAKIVLFD